MADVTTHERLPEQEARIEARGSFTEVLCVLSFAMSRPRRLGPDGTA